MDLQLFYTGRLGGGWGGIHYLPHYGTESFMCGVFPNSKQCQNWGHPVSIHRELEKLLGLKKKKPMSGVRSEG